MAPKAAEKKAVAKKAIAYVQKEIDSSRYIRKQEHLEPIETTSVTPQLTGLLANVDHIFPEWSIAHQNWHDNQDSEEYVKYPAELRHHALQSIRAVLNLEATESRSKTKVDSKKLKEHSSEIYTENLVDDEGRKLPRILFRDESALYDYYQPLLLKRTFSADQIERKFYQDALYEGISTSDSNTINNDNTVSSDSASRKAEAQLAYDNAILERDVRLEGAKGVETDHNMCAAFRIISEFAQKIGSTIDSPDGNVPMRFLWNSIYPQLPSGKPVYNASGKYAVKLFLAGKWRKVLVTDTVPVGTDGPVLASSQEPLELWPLILAKAVYSVYTACGYHNTLPTLLDTPGGRRGQKTGSISSTHKTSFFVGFAVHVLTGWQPSTPRSIADTIDLDIQRARGLLQEMLFGGATNVHENDIPDSDPPTLRMGGGVSGGGIVLQDLQKYQTKKLFKEEYSLRFAERAQVIQDIALRENRAEQLDAALSVPCSEGFLLCLQAPSSSSLETAAVPPSVITVPILGICLMNNDTGRLNDLCARKTLNQFILDDGHEDSDFALLNNIKMLIKWRTSAPLEASDNPAAESLPAEIASLLHGINDPLPPSTVIESEWISLRELAARQAYIVGVDTNIRLPYNALLNCTWSPMLAEKGADKAPKVTAIKGKNIVETFRTPNVVCGDTGNSPPLLLSLSTKDFFQPVEISMKEGTADISSHMDDAVRMQDAGLRALDSTPASVPLTPGRITLAPSSAYLSISLSIHADITVPSDDASSLSPRVPLSAGKRPSVAPSISAFSPAVSEKKDIPMHSPARDPFLLGGEGTGDTVLPSDVTVVLQELRTDSKEPLVMRIELSPCAQVPLTRTTFHIPSDRVDSHIGQLVFWVRLFTKASVHLGVSCAVPVVMGEVEDLWSGLGGHVMVREGDAAASRASTEQLLFRVPLQIHPSPIIDEHSSLKSLQDDNDGSDERKDEVMDLPSPGLKGVRNEHYVTAFLHISDRAVARSVSLLLASSGRGDSYTMPRIDGNNFMLSDNSQNMKTLIARCFTPETPSSSSAHAHGVANSMLPGFKWKLLIISSVPLVEPPVASAPSSIVRSLQQRFRGAYRPNNRLVLFRDVYSVDASSFPLALRISTHPLRSVATASETWRGVDGDYDINLTEGISIIVRVYRKADRALMSESRGRSVVQLYQIPLEGLVVSPDVNLASAPDTPTKGKKVVPKKADTKNAGGRKSAQDEVEFILECTLDESCMLIPPFWRARIPFLFVIDPSETPSTGGQGTGRGKSRDGPGEEKPVPTPASTLHPSLCPSAATPQFQWLVDVLAGSVLDVSHDTYDLEKQLECKNAWEENSQGRAERAIAAMAFVAEKKSLRTSILFANESDPKDLLSGIQGLGPGVGQGLGSTGSPVSGTDRLVDLLAQALEKEEQRAMLAEREVRLLSLNEYKEHIEDWRGTAPYRIEPAALEAQRLVRADRKETTEADSRRMTTLMLELNDTMRGEASSRVQALSAHAVAAASAIGQQWEAREACRNDALTKAQRFKMQSERIAAELAVIAAASELAIAAELKDRKNNKGKISTPLSNTKRQSFA